MVEHPAHSQFPSIYPRLHLFGAQVQTGFLIVLPCGLPIPQVLAALFFPVDVFGDRFQHQSMSGAMAVIGKGFQAVFEFIIKPDGCCC
jgi:hypothetical protein